MTGIKAVYIHVFIYLYSLVVIKR